MILTIIQNSVLTEKLKVSYLNEVYKLRPWFSKSLNLQISYLVGYFKKICAFLVYAMSYHENVHNKINAVYIENWVK